jgi:hypothetical protein
MTKGKVKGNDRMLENLTQTYEISSSHGGEYDVQNCLPEDNSP